MYEFINTIDYWTIMFNHLVFQLTMVPFASHNPTSLGLFKLPHCYTPQTTTQRTPLFLSPTTIGHFMLSAWKTRKEKYIYPRGTWKLKKHVSKLVDPWNWNNSLLNFVIFPSLRWFNFQSLMKVTATSWSSQSSNFWTHWSMGLRPAWARSSQLQ